MPSNIEKFGLTMHGQMRSVGNAKSKNSTELGKIRGANLTLMPDESPGPIPPGEYSVGRSAKKGGLSAGDRVLINWCGDEAVVIDVID